MPKNATASPTVSPARPSACRRGSRNASLLGAEKPNCVAGLADGHYRRRSVPEDHTTYAPRPPWGTDSGHELEDGPQCGSDRISSVGKPPEMSRARTYLPR